jgi:hypothetical protein
LLGAVEDLKTFFAHQNTFIFGDINVFRGWFGYSAYPGAIDLQPRRREIAPGRGLDPFGLFAEGSFMRPKTIQKKLEAIADDLFGVTESDYEAICRYHGLSLPPLEIVFRRWPGKGESELAKLLAGGLNGGAGSVGWPSYRTGL